MAKSSASEIRGWKHYAKRSALPTAVGATETLTRGACWSDPHFRAVTPTPLACGRRPAERSRDL